eukprot:Sspe_Gene.17206::Locus_6104_Transcript_6_6_Confidence_0.273_Length_3248::g.17206::m.17206
MRRHRRKPRVTVCLQIVAIALGCVLLIQQAGLLGGSTARRTPQPSDTDAIDRNDASGSGDGSLSASSSASTFGTTSPPLQAYVTYVRAGTVDAAIALGWSLHRYSMCFSKGSCALVALVESTQTLQDGDEHRLGQAGWGQPVPIDDDLPIQAIGRLRYSEVAYLHVASLARPGVDGLFKKRQNEKGLVVVAGSEQDRVAVLVVDPRRSTPEELEAVEPSVLQVELHSSCKAGKSKGGVLLHWCPQPSSSVPWQRPAWGGDGQPTEGVAIDGSFYEWWATYENFVDWEKEDGRADWGGRHRRSGIGPRTHYWLHRHTSDEFVVPRREEVLGHLGSKPPAMTVVPATADKGCDVVCSERQSVCYEKGLLRPEVNSCDAARGLFPCKCSAHLGHGPHLPSYNTKSGLCTLPALPFTPSCRAAAKGHLRLCPCVPQEQVGLPSSDLPQDATPVALMS